MRVEQREQLIHVRRREQLQLRAKRRTVVQRADRRFSLLSRPEDPNRRHFALQIHLQHLAILRVPVDLADPRLLVHREFLRRERGGSARKEANQLAAQHAAAGEDFVGVVGAEQAEKLVLRDGLPDGEVEETANELHADVLLLEENEDGDVAGEEVGEASDEDGEALRSDGGGVVDGDVGDEKEDELDGGDDGDLRGRVADGEAEEERLDPVDDSFFGGGQEELERLEEARDDRGGEQALKFGLGGELLEQREEEGGEGDDAGKPDGVGAVMRERGLATGGGRGGIGERVVEVGETMRHDDDLVECALEKKKGGVELELLLEKRFKGGENVELLEENEVFLGPIIVQNVE